VIIRRDIEQVLFSLCGSTSAYADRNEVRIAPKVRCPARIQTK
jgi:hypothetical protein